MTETYGISNTSVIPLRAEPSEGSEMYTQLLWGEHFEVIEEIERWIKIKNAADNYIGWIDKKMYCKISKEVYGSISNSPNAITSELFTYALKSFSEPPIRICAGSILPLFNESNQTFIINNDTYYLKEKIALKRDYLSGDSIADYAKTFLNCPYLWGGKNPFGIDCSGLTQIAYKVHGIQIPRDAKDQVIVGKEVSFDQAKPGDLALFNNASNKITHVGIVLSNNTIIHASGKVRIDKLSSEGIFNNESGLQTHTLHSIRFVF